MLEEIIEFSKIVGKLKENKRTGWITRLGAKNPESIADHTFRTAVLAMIIADMRELNTEKMVRMALLHDLEEAIIGDWDVDKKNELGVEEFERVRRESIRKILSSLPGELEEKYTDLWNEIHEKKTEEARLIEEIDKLEMAFQALEYEKEGYDKKKLDDFWDFVRIRLKDSELWKIFESLEKERG